MKLWPCTVIASLHSCFAAQLVAYQWLAGLGSGGWKPCWSLGVTRSGPKARARIRQAGQEDGDKTPGGRAQLAFNYGRVHMMASRPATTR
ncbi:hypothetical protein V8C86DRAFT_2873580 [Haematococcus lacustris]